MASTTGLLEGNVAIVTGGRRGIGKAIALALAGAGSSVAICALNQDAKLDAVANEITQLGQRSLALKADVSRKADIDNMVQRVLSEFGKIDILVNCAGIIISGYTLLECNEVDWDSVINTNLKGTYLCSQAVAKKMVAQRRGNIINMTSDLGINPTPGIGAYGVSKAGIILLTRQMALELAKYNIRINAIAPGMTRTDMNIHFRSTPEMERKIASARVLGRLAEPSDISKVALFLASDNSSYITGETITVNGGGQIEPPLVN